MNTLNPKPTNLKRLLEVKDAVEEVQRAHRKLDSFLKNAIDGDFFQIMEEHLEGIYSLAKYQIGEHVTIYPEWTIGNGITGVVKDISFYEDKKFNYYVERDDHHSLNWWRETELKYCQCCKHGDKPAPENSTGSNTVSITKLPPALKVFFPGDKVQYVGNPGLYGTYFTGEKGTIIAKSPTTRDSWYMYEVAWDGRVQDKHWYVPDYNLELVKEEEYRATNPWAWS